MGSYSDLLSHDGAFAELIKVNIIYWHRTAGSHPTVSNKLKVYVKSDEISQLFKSLKSNKKIAENAKSD